MMKTNKKCIELYSFDIFDTLITRRVGTPKGIFSIMQGKIHNKVTLPEDFYTMRVDSESFAREVSNNKEINFEDIYNQMQNSYKLSAETITYLKELEIETEIENLVGIEENISKIINLRQNNSRVVLISDMYHSSETLRLFLSHINPVFESIRVYVSSECKTSKYEGKLFQLVKELEAVNYKNWLHTGDNEISDIKQAKKYGIQTEYYNFPSLMIYEKNLLESYPNSITNQILVGASRITRLKQVNNKEKYDFGASFSAPILYNYVNWVLDDAIKKNVKTLHFIARDGFIPKIMADIIIKKRELNIKTKYIYGSRLAWRIPSEENYAIFIENLMSEYWDKLSLSFIAYRLHIKPEQISKYLNIKNSNAIFDEKQRIEIKNKMLQDERIKSIVVNRNKDKIDLLIKYIKQEFDLAENIAFVDINGSGKTQDFLSLFINSIYKCTVHTYYIVTSYSDMPCKTSIKYTYYKKPKPHYHYLELLCRAYGGQTLGYKEENTKICPIRENISNDAMIEWGFESYLQGVIDFTKEILNYKDYINNLDFCYFYYDYLTTKCDYNTAVIVGDIPFLTIGSEKKATKAAPELSLLEVLLLLFKGRKIDELSEFPHITFVRGNAMCNIIKNFLLKMQLLPDSFIELRLYLKLKFLKNKKIMFWGASLWLENFINKYNIKNKNILGIIDKNTNRQGSYVGPYQILSPAELKIQKADYLVMTIKNHNINIYNDVANFIYKNHIDVTLLPNIFSSLKN